MGLWEGLWEGRWEVGWEHLHDGLEAVLPPRAPPRRLAPHTTPPRTPPLSSPLHPPPLIPRATPCSALRTVYATEGHSFKVSLLWAEIVQKHTPVGTNLIWDGDAAAPEPLQVVGDTSPQAAVAPQMLAPDSRQGRRLAALAAPTPYTGDTTKSSSTANGYTVEPPDQALCVGAGYVMEGTNNQATRGAGGAAEPPAGGAGWRGVVEPPARAHPQPLPHPRPSSTPPAHSQPFTRTVVCAQPERALHPPGGLAQAHQRLLRLQ